MIILEQVKVTENKLYDSIYSDDLYSWKRIKIVDGGYLSFKPTIYQENQFSLLLSKFNTADKDRILKEGKFSNELPLYYKNFIKSDELESHEFPYHGSETHLSLSFSIENNFLIIYTIGEKQPSRWILIIEGVWAIESTN